MDWKLLYKYRSHPKYAGMQQMRAIAVFEDSSKIASTWWSVDDGSAEAELHQLVKKKKQSIQR